MEKIDEFVSYFTGQKIDNILRVKDGYFLAGRELKETSEKTGQTPFAIGLFLGKLKNRNFVPGASILNIISKKTDRKVFVNRKTEWLFLCGRDIFGKGIVKANVKKGKVLVQNERDENLGYGEVIEDISEKDKIVVKNLFDKGAFLRREKRGGLWQGK